MTFSPASRTRGNATASASHCGGAVVLSGYAQVLSSLLPVREPLLLAMWMRTPGSSHPCSPLTTCRAAIGDGDSADG